MISPVVLLLENILCFVMEVLRLPACYPKAQNLLTIMQVKTKMVKVATKIFRNPRFYEAVQCVHYITDK